MRQTLASVASGRYAPRRDSQGARLHLPAGQPLDATPAPVGGATVPALNDLLHADPDDFVARHPDIAAVNLACARGLPNCDEREFPDHLALLDTIAEAVRQQTDRSFRLFKLKPKQFNGSEAVFRLYTMEHVFRVQFGVRYDPKVREVTEGGRLWTSDDSSELFIHGLLGPKRTGTCSSLPTFAIAVGRRLGYPLKLVLVPNHTLYRWDDGAEVFNLQPTEAGGEVRSDESFRQWPRRWDAVDHAINTRTKVWLHSLTPRKEASKFLCNRALLLRDVGRHREAIEALDAAGRFDPINPAVADIHHSVEYAMVGGDVPSLIGGDGPRYTGGLGGNGPLSFASFAVDACTSVAWPTGVELVNLAPPSSRPTSSSAVAERRWREQAAVADEHARLVGLINESNRTRSPQHPDGNPPIGPLLLQLTRLLHNQKGH